MQYFAGFSCDISGIHLLAKQLMLYVLPVLTLVVGRIIYKKVGSNLRIIIPALTILMAFVVLSWVRLAVLPWGCDPLGF